MSVVNYREILPVLIEKEMQSSYLDYAMSVIVSRALPDIRDGLKPVHRRILFSMHESAYAYNKPHRKCARIVGDVMGKYHPHGDSAIYDSLVRMAQEFSLRLPLIDGQGNFGSIDGDEPAAMRYTESRLAKVAQYLLNDIDKNTIDFQPNYDGSEKEPSILPAAYPNLLVNGASGIAVGMATNIPPHNLGEVLDACCAYMDNNNIDIEALMAFIPGPDFPTGGVILGNSVIKTAYHNGRGVILLRGVAVMENIDNNKKAIIITEIPYAVNKSKMIEKIAELVNAKTIEGISDLRDESNKSGIRVVIELKKDAYPDVILNQLYRYTQLQTSFGINLLAIDDGLPKLFNLKEMIVGFINFRKEVVTRRTVYLLDQARSRAHILIGLYIAVSDIDTVIKMIKASKDPTEAKNSLMEMEWNNGEIIKWIQLIDNSDAIITSYRLTERQAKAILEMRLHRLTALEKNKIVEDIKVLLSDITEFLSILNSEIKLCALIREELTAMKEFATPRLTQIQEDYDGVDSESLIPKEDMIVTITLRGYIKRMPIDTYRTQHRGGRGKSGLSMEDDDVTTEVFIANTHSNILFFSTHGQVYSLKLYKLPLGSTQSKGRPIVNLLQLSPEEKINNIVALPSIDADQSNEDLSVIFATKLGNIRRSDIGDFTNIRANGKIAIRLEDNDELISVKIANNDEHILLATKLGKAIRFAIQDLRLCKSRTSDGVRGIKLTTNDSVVGMTIVNGIEFDSVTREKYLDIPLDVRLGIKNSLTAPLSFDCKSVDLTEDQVITLAQHEQFILSLTSNGYGKRSSAYEYRITNRGGSGIINISSSAKIGHLVATISADERDQIILITDKGQVIRCKVSDIRSTGRNTSGVILFRTSENETVVSAALIANEDIIDSEI